ncbi:hypothetical protein E2R62_19725 [Citrobacter rodentium]|uniref:Uncharacterized protein n=1 Tax=Citrobacter rodentium TaxID=67825 RepID=A0A482PJE4_CITRO|nr:hypothetical protein E2R62_19725 [Citrobacter rodentium]
MAARRMAPTIKPIATERKSLTNMMVASLKKGTTAAYHELTGHHTRGRCPVTVFIAGADKYYRFRVPPEVR